MFLHESYSKQEKESELKFEFVNRVSEQEKEIIQKEYKGLSDKCFKKDKQKADKPYKVILGEGTFSKVRLARAEINGKTYYFALRKIRTIDELETPTEGKPKSPLSRPQVYDMTEKELQLLEHLKDFGIENVAIPLTVIRKQNKLGQDQLYQVFPLADMGNANKLIELLNSDSISESERNALFNHIALILIHTVGFLNDHDFYVNDIKPENILLSSLGNIWLSDFGSAFSKIQGRYIEASSVSDPKYLHPAVLSDKINGMKIDKKDRGLNNDGWALALTLLELYSDETRKIAANMKGLIYTHRDKNYNLDTIKEFYAAQIKTLQSSNSFGQMPKFFQLVITDLLNLNIDKRKQIVDIVSAYSQEGIHRLSQTKVASLFDQLLLSSQQPSTKLKRVDIASTSVFKNIADNTAKEGYQEDEGFEKKMDPNRHNQPNADETGYQDDEDSNDYNKDTRTASQDDKKATEDSAHPFFSSKSGDNNSTISRTGDTLVKSTKKL